MEIQINLNDGVESDSITRGSARRKARRARKAGTKPTATKPAAKKPTGARRTATAPKKPVARKPAAKKEVKVPNSVEVMIQRSKPKLRIMHKQPGRYVMKSTKGQFVLFRIKEQVKYLPSMKQKLFAMRDMEAIATSVELEDLQAHAALDAALGEGTYAEPLEHLEAESHGLDIAMDDDAIGGGSGSIEADSAAPGARNAGAGAKLGKKKRAPNMLAPGWHMFVQPKDGNKLQKHYVGPRMSARRLMGIVSGEAKPGADAKKPAAGTKKPAAKPASKTGRTPAVKNELTKSTGLSATKMRRMIKDATKDGDKKELARVTKLKDAMESGDLNATKRALRSIDKQSGLDEFEKELGLKEGALRNVLSQKASKKPAASPATKKRGGNKPAAKKQ